MKPLGKMITLLGVIYFAGGCTRTYISTGDPGVPAPDGSTTRICWTIHGAFGRSYIERTKKLVDVCIKRGQLPQPQVLFLERYKFFASDLGGDARWVSPDVVVVEFYDYGDGVSSYDARKAGTSSNHMATLIFQLDKQSGKFTENR